MRTLRREVIKDSPVLQEIRKHQAICNLAIRQCKEISRALIIEGDPLFGLFKAKLVQAKYEALIQKAMEK